jgi:hypothetical protein
LKAELKVRVASEMVAAVDAFCLEYGWTRSDILRDAVIEYLVSRGLLNESWLKKVRTSAPGAVRSTPPGASMPRVSSNSPSSHGRKSDCTFAQREVDSFGDAVVKRVGKGIPEER